MSGTMITLGAVAALVAAGRTKRRGSRSEADDFLSFLKAKRDGSDQGLSSFSEYRSGRLSRAERIADQILSQVSPTGVRISAREEPEASSGFVWRVEDDTDPGYYFEVGSPTYLREIMVAFKRKRKRLKRFSSSEIQKLLERPYQNVRCPSPGCVGDDVGQECKRPSGHTFYGKNRVHPERMDRYDRYILRQDARKGFSG